MKINQELDFSNYNIRSYQAGAVLIQKPMDSDNSKPEELTIRTSFLIMPKKLIDNWPVTDVKQLQIDKLITLLDFSPELLLLGTGNQISFPDPAIIGRFNSEGIGVEVMDTAAACRTYNILMNEGRNVAALILQG